MKFARCYAEPRCSKFDFEEKLLENVVKMEHATAVMMNQFKDISMEVKDSLHKIKENFEEIKLEAKEELERDKQLIEGKKRQFYYLFHYELDTLDKLSGFFYQADIFITFFCDFIEWWRVDPHIQWRLNTKSRQFVPDLTRLWSGSSRFCYWFSFALPSKKGKKKVQGVPQSQTAALPRHQEEEETDKSKQAQIEQTYKKH